MDVGEAHKSPHSLGFSPRPQHPAAPSLPYGVPISNGCYHYQNPEKTAGTLPLMSSSLQDFPPQNQSSMALIVTSQPTHNQTTSTFDPRNLEIKTRSVEQTLLPLVQQISTLVTFQKESIITGARPKSERALRAALKIGTAVEAAVERFVAVGETIADENPDIQPELYDACHEARLAGSSIANLHSSMLAEDGQENGISGTDLLSNQPSPPAVVVDSVQLVRAARQLLSSVTRVLLLADRVLVKHILRAEDKIAYSLTKLEHTSNFSEFVQIFTEFGNQMVDLAHRSGDRQQDLKSEKRRAQMQVARAQLERLTMLLLTSSKTLLRHPEDTASRQCRDGVFHQIRSALQLVAVCVTDGVTPFDVASAYPSPLDELSRTRDGPLDIGIQLTASVAIRQLCEMMSLIGMMPLIGSGVRERLVSALNALCEMSADFTESAWTPIQQREQILDLLEECRFEMGNLVNPPPQNNIIPGGDESRLQNGNNEITVERLNRRLKDLRKQLQVVGLEQIATVFRQNEDQTILSSLKTCSISGDIDGVERFLEQFRLHAEHLQEVCRLLHHISLTDALHVFTGHAERNLRALAPLTLLAGRVLCVHPSSRIARENLEVFCDTWATNVNDLARMSKELDAACSGRLAAEKQAYMSLPRPGVSLALVSSSPVSFCSSACAVPMLSHNMSSSFSSFMSKSVVNSVSDSCDVVVGGCAVLPHHHRSNKPQCQEEQQKQLCHPTTTSPMDQCGTIKQSSTAMFAASTRTPPAPTPKDQTMPTSDSGFSQSISEEKESPASQGGKDHSATDKSWGKVTKGQMEDKVMRRATTKEEHPDDGGTKKNIKGSKDEKKSLSKSISALWRRMKGEEPKLDANEKKGVQEEGDKKKKKNRPNSVEDFLPRRMEVEEDGFSKSLKVELERAVGKRTNDECGGGGGNDPLYSTIRKSGRAAKNAHDPSASQTNQKSAFTPYSEFNVKHTQQKGRNLPFAVTPPRPRRTKTEGTNANRKSNEHEKGMVRFNRIYGREEEPVIVRQQSQQQRSNKKMEERKEKDEEEDDKRVVIPFKHGKGRKGEGHPSTPMLSRQQCHRVKAPLAKWEETDESKEDEEQDDSRMAERMDGEMEGRTVLERADGEVEEFVVSMSKVGMDEEKRARVLDSEGGRRALYGQNEQRHGTTSKPTKPITLDVEDQQKIAKVGLEMKLLTAEVEAEAEKWDEYAENDIVKRAKAMSAMSYNMYLFTKGDGPLKTTHDLFTQAEFFAEQANKMHKTVMEFAFEVPGSAEKNELLQVLDKVPFHCQQLQVLVKSPTVGKSATFSKVDAVISETKSLMNEIAKLVTACFVCATKFEIEFRGTVGPRSGIGDDDLGRGYSSQRASRESSAVWRRTPSMRRPIPQHSPQFLTAAAGVVSSNTATAVAGEGM
uniref:Alpha-catulin n=1 Tax=Globodera rostochiensis TaxID=31243 RepID=A0A914HFZ8_GLORO